MLLMNFVTRCDLFWKSVEIYTKRVELKVVFFNYIILYIDYEFLGWAAPWVNGLGRPMGQWAGPTHGSMGWAAPFAELGLTVVNFMGSGWGWTR